MSKLRRIKQYLEKYEWYLKLRFSILHNLLLRIRNYSQYQAIQNESSMYSSLLKQLDSKHPLVFDIGANIGQLTKAFLEAGANRVIAVEPDYNNFRILNARFGNHPQVTLINEAVSNQETQLPFFQQKRGGALSTLSPKWKDLLEHKKMDRSFGHITFKEASELIKTTTLDQLIEEYGIPDFIKIDVEGHELEVLQGLSHPVGMISFEANLPEFLEETITGIKCLSVISDKTQFNLSSDDATLLFSNYVEKNVLIDELNNTEYRCITIFCRIID